MQRNTRVYCGLIVDVHRERVTLPNGAEAELEIVHHPGGAAIVALDDNSNVCLLRQYRHVAGAWLWELPAGKRDAHEAPILTAQRELEEEAGRRADRWEPLGSVVSSPGVFNEVVHLFLARDLVPLPEQPEPHEVFEVHWVPMAEALARARSGEIIDAKTVVGLFRAEPFLQRPSPVR